MPVVKLCSTKILQFLTFTDWPALMLCVCVCRWHTNSVLRAVTRWRTRVGSISGRQRYRSSSPVCNYFQDAGVSRSVHHRTSQCSSSAVSSIYWRFRRPEAVYVPPGWSRCVVAPVVYYWLPGEWNCQLLQVHHLLNCMHVFLKWPRNSSILFN